MSEMRYPIYAWSDGLTMNLWARAEAKDDGVYDPIHNSNEPSEHYPGFVSGVAMPEDVYDELAVIRFARLIEEGRAAEVVRRVGADRPGNFGAWPLLRALRHDPDGEFRKVMEAARRAPSGGAA